MTNPEIHNMSLIEITWQPSLYYPIFEHHILSEKNQNRSFVDNVKGVLDQYFANSENHQTESTGSKYKKAKFVSSKFTLIELRLRKSLANWRFWEKEVEKCCAFDFFVVLQLCGFGSTKAAMSEISFPKLSCNVLLGSTGRANMFLSF